MLQQFVLQEFLFQFLDMFDELILFGCELLRILHLLLTRHIHLGHELLLVEFAQTFSFLLNLLLGASDGARRFHPTAWNDVGKRFVAPHQIGFLKTFDRLILRDLLGSMTAR